MDLYNKSHYDLDQIKELIITGNCRVTIPALDGGVALGFSDRSAIMDRVLRLAKSEIYKTMPAKNLSHPGLWQDVYKTSEDGCRIYIKLQLSPVNGAVIISFKEDEEWAQR